MLFTPFESETGTCLPASLSCLNLLYSSCILLSFLCSLSLLTATSPSPPPPKKIVKRVSEHSTSSTWSAPPSHLLYLWPLLSAYGCWLTPLTSFSIFNSDFTGVYMSVVLSFFSLNVSHVHLSASPRLVCGFFFFLVSCFIRHCLKYF